MRLLFIALPCEKGKWETIVPESYREQIHSCPASRVHKQHCSPVYITQSTVFLQKRWRRRGRRGRRERRRRGRRGEEGEEGEDRGEEEGIP
jgi:ribose 1,5-bisphosphokinase PhnN